eukprot:CAMPEP_0196141868 /NCGR_PEP_ID=MMETSP0910-20130528/10682_1 /TAXON_ID=49265 /ORGANISM="Thalassiosira rotula, Strain GSO102" /LENGTH=734 /DNA_ID=CAMNT_0041403097 /DNA_START=133 /DNA_END=2337 /DNA_ORIENTATION=+
MLLPKVSFIPALLLVLASQDASARPSVSPHRISLASLQSTNASPNSAPLQLMDGLTHDGILSITDIPSFKETKKAVMSHLHACIMSVGDDVPTQRFPDGTIRRSFATSTNRVDGPQPLKTLDHYKALAGDHGSESCARFRTHLSAFRSSVDRVTMQFAESLSAAMGALLPKPLVSPRNGVSNAGEYEDIKKVVDGGEHLEHFHSYQKAGAAGEETIEFHTDQGLFIAFTPGLIVSSNPSLDVELSDGFYVQGSDGEKILMQFTGDDDLVFMMGDGVNQFINDKLTDGKKALQATPHALTVPALEDVSKARVWYGRMVLPPMDAFIPSMGSTFGETRQVLVDSSPTGDMPLGVGCSSPNMKAFIDTSRNLDGEEEEPKCPDDELFCWFRCMALADHGIQTPTTCAERNLGLQCANPRLQVIPDGLKHGDYWPQCTNNTHITHPYTNYPEIPQPDEDICAGEWEEFSAKGDYDHMITVTVPEETAREGAIIVDTKLYWSIIESDDGMKKIKGRVAYSGPFGWLAVGFASPDGKHNGMNGGNIIMAKPGGNYSPVTGLDLGVEPSTGTYKIDENGSSHRHWSTPIDTEETRTTVSDYEVHNDGCFTALTFESDHINGQKFNVEGIDDMIWAGNGLDHFVGHHGRGGRARFTVDWKSGEMTYLTPEVKVEPIDIAVATADGDVHNDANGEYDDGHADGDGAGNANDEEVDAAENDGFVKKCVVGLFTSLVGATMMQYL